MTLPACLVTSSPSFEERKQTPPFLLAETADPDLRMIHVIDLKDTQNVSFGAGVVSEDAGAEVIGHLVIDYGYRVQGGDPTPYRSEIGLEVSIEPATIDDPPRTLTATWNIPSHTPALGCHNVALFATHDFNPATGCAADPADFDYLMWTIILCDSTQGTCCKPDAPPDQGGCSIQCPEFDTKVRCGPSAGDSP